jgi:hemoglobin
MLKSSRFNNFFSLVSAASVATFFAFSAPAIAQESNASPSLYARVGGYDFIAKFVDTAFPRVATQPQLHRLFQGHSIDSQFRQRQLIVDALCKEMGGPCIYIGRPMVPLHEGLHITNSDWAEFMKIITAALVELKVPQQERSDWIALFEQKFRPAIVEQAANKSTVPYGYPAP